MRRTRPGSEATGATSTTVSSSIAHRSPSNEPTGSGNAGGVADQVWTLGRRWKEQFTDEGPFVRDGRAREATGRHARRRKEVDETGAVAKREATADAPAVTARAATGLVEEEIRKRAARQDRLRRLATLEIAEQRIVLRKDKRETSHLGSLQDAIDWRGVEAERRR